MLDVYEHCVVKRISPEAPVPIASVIHDAHFLGGAGNVANNLRSFGASVSLVSVVGDDQAGQLLRQLLLDADIDHDAVSTSPGRVTTQKKRVISGTQQLMRIDREVVSRVDEVSKEIIHESIKRKIMDCDVVIVSDYCKGFVDDDLIAVIRSVSMQYDKKVLVDSKDKAFLKYAGFYLIKPNKEEAEHFAGERFHQAYENLESVGKRLQSLFQSNVVITLGGDGMALFEKDTFLHKPTQTREVFDVSGAGDTVLATMTVAIAVGATLEQAMDLSNCAAGHVVSRLGTTVCTPAILKEKLNDISL
jgi:D-beta-D-heptose 7-phosphate kinase/D-beta-D-heptose 1-phosphate adenosyltransferase